MHKLLKKILNITFVLIIILSLLITSIYMIFIKEPDVISEIEKRELISFDNIKDTKYIDGSFQETLENALSDQFPYRYTWVTYKKRLDLFLSTLFDKKSNTIIDNDDEEEIRVEDYILHRIGEDEIYKVGDSNYLMLGLVQYDEEYVNRYMTKINEINELANDYPNIGIYVYKPIQAHETNMFNEINELNGYGDQYHELLKNNLKVPYKQFEINNVNDYKEYFYAQDHHWNYKGSYQGYLDIVHLILGEDAEVVTPKREITNDDKLLWSGTFGARTSYILPYEAFHYYTYDLPKYHVYYKGQEVPVNDMNNIDEQIASNDSTYYYTFLNTNNEPFEEFVSEKEGMPSLLIIGDSYASAIEPLLMNNFSKIYFVNPHRYRWLMNYGQYFDIDDFIAKYDVDNILFMYTGENWFYDDDGSCFNFELHRKGAQ